MDLFSVKYFACSMLAVRELLWLMIRKGRGFESRSSNVLMYLIKVWSYQQMLESVLEDSSPYMKTMKQIR